MNLSRCIDLMSLRTKSISSVAPVIVVDVINDKQQKNQTYHFKTIAIINEFTKR